jgi:hypothetical protein
MCMHIHIHLFMCIYYVHINIWTCTGINVHLLVCMHVCMHVCMYVCTYVCVCMSFISIQFMVSLIEPRHHIVQVSIYQRNSTGRTDSESCWCMHCKILTVTAMVTLTLCQHRRKGGKTFLMNEGQMTPTATCKINGNHS